MFYTKKNRNIVRMAPIGFVMVMLCLSQFGYSQVEMAQGKWKQVELPFISFSVPPDVEEEKVQGRDSAVWKFSNQSLILTLDLGMYSGKPASDKEEDCYSERSTVVNGKKASLVTFVFANQNDAGFRYVTAAYFRKIGSEGNKLSFVVLGKTPGETLIAEKIIRSIVFK